MANDLIFRIIGDDVSGRAFASAMRSIKGVGSEIAAAQVKLRAFGASAKRIGATMSATLSAPIGLFGADVLRTAGQFEASMNRVQALSSATGDQFTALREQAKDLGRTTQFSASQAADAMGFLAMAGFNANKIVGAMPGTLNLAAASQMELAETADIVSNVLTGFSKPVEDLAQINDVLVKTMTSTNTDLRMLGDAFKYVGPVASAAGLEFNEVSAAIGLLGNAGIQGEMGGTALRGAISKILNPTKQARAAMGEFGLELTDVNGRLKPLNEVLDELAPHADNAGLFMQLFGQRAGPGMQALVSQGSAALTDLTAKLDESGGTAQRIADAQMRGFNGAMKELRSAFEGLKIAIADSGLLGALTDFVKWLAGAARSLAEANPKFVKFGVVFAGVAAVLGPLVATLGLVAAGLGALSAPVLLVIGGVTAAAATFAAFSDEIMAFLDDPAKKAVDWGRGLAEAAGGGVRDFGTVVDTTFNNVAGLIDTVVPGVGDDMIRFKDHMVGAATVIAARLPELIPQAIQAVREAVTEFTAGVSTRFAAWKTEFLAAMTAFKDAVVARIASIFEEIGGRISATFDRITGLWSQLQAAIFGKEHEIKIGVVEVIPGAASSQVFDGAALGPLEFESLDASAVERMAADTEAAMQRLRGSAAVGSEAFDRVRESARVMEDAVTGNSYVTDMVDDSIAHFERLRRDAVPPAVGAFESVRFAAQDMAAAVTGTLKSAFATGEFEFRGFKDRLIGIGERLVDDMLDRVLQPFEDALSKTFGAALSGLSSGGGGFASVLGGGLSAALGGLFGGFFANGGTLAPGQFGIAGEAGEPELVFGGRSGATVIPARRLGFGGGAGLYMPVTINAPGADAAQLRRVEGAVVELGRRMPAMMREYERRAG